MPCFYYSLSIIKNFSGFVVYFLYVFLNIITFCVHLFLNYANGIICLLFLSVFH